MKTLKLLLPLFLLFAIFTPAMAKSEKKVETVTYVCSIDCDHCKKTIMKNIPYEKGVKNVEVDIKTKEVKVTFRKDKTDCKKLESAIEKLGYDAELKKSCCGDKKK
ncbi:cation transporter [Halosquirtibacter xylanolyticus]|uniref:heavy-metal-associated domain-containing protein n=1 Tax=Halosquirtibacter xylanolyticus TaxID=3374599 RepID=UPI0037485753|nr:cation transporter [Prolixibacteraceae bacterium]